jgi:hypothetical protein
VFVLNYPLEGSVVECYDRSGDPILRVTHKSWPIVRSAGTDRSVNPDM